MKKGNNFWVITIAFLGGTLVCYILVQFHYFNINTEVNVIETILSIGTAIIGLYIADSIQKRLTKTQNMYSFVEGKLDVIWEGFIKFSQKIMYNDIVEVNEINKYVKEASHSLGFLKSILASYKIGDDCVSALESEIEALEEFIYSLPISNNIITVGGGRAEIETRMLSINKCFSDLLKLIHNI